MLRMNDTCEEQRDEYGQPRGEGNMSRSNAEIGIDENWCDVRVPSSATGPDQPDPRMLEPWNLHSSLRGYGMHGAAKWMNVVS
jgi:hypothetical protein